MTFEPTDTNGNTDAWPAEVADLLGDGPTPSHRSDFWNQVEAGLGVAPVVVTERGARGTADADDVSAFGGTFDDTVVPLRSAEVGPNGDGDHERRGVGRWLIAAAAAFLAILGVSTFLLNDAADDKSTVYAGDGADDYSSRPAAVDDTGRVILSPLVDFAATRNLEADTVMFTIEASMPLRTRLAVLDRFNDSVWISEGDYRSVNGGTLDREFVDPRMATASFRGTAIIDVPDGTGLTLWRPLPFETQTVTVLEGGNLSYEGRNVQLVAGAGERDGGRDRYEVTYSPPIAGRSVEGLPVMNLDDVPDAMLAPYLELTDSTRARFAADAARLLDGDESPSERAAKLLDHFSSIAIDPAARPGHSFAAATQTIELNEGSPESIVSGLATMARAVDIPSRVVVGFGPGELAEDQGDLWVVRGRDAAVWVELFVDGVWQMYDPMPVGSAAGPTSGYETPPVMNRDHWHAIFAMYDCATDSYLPPLMSDRDEYGIHSHQDSLIHIHPWFESSAGENATLDIYFETMGIEVAADRIVAADDGIELSPSGSCPEGSVVHLRKWAFDFQVEEKPLEVVTANIGDVRFMNDREVYVLAVAPIDAELPPIPDDLFAMPNTHTAPDDITPGAALTPAPPARIDGSLPIDTSDDATVFLEDRVGQAIPIEPSSLLYPVEAGDSLGQIATKFNTTVEDILAANPGVNPAALEVGDVLVVPGEIAIAEAESAALNAIIEELRERELVRPGP